MYEKYREYVLEVAREAIETWVKEGKQIEPKNIPEELKEPKGVFVSIYKIVKGEKVLRGCVGLPHAEKPLIEALVEAAILACRDPRFKPLSEEELKNITIEVSILSEPELIKVKKPEEYLEKIKPGEGLIIKKGFHSGLFLPQVWEEIPDKKEFLENLCLKAGLLPDAWLDENVRIYRFKAEVLK
jgi:hypothetical protein